LRRARNSDRGEIAALGRACQTEVEEFVKFNLVKQELIAREKKNAMTE